MNAKHTRIPKRLLAVLPAVLLCGCQVVTAASPPESRLFANRPSDSVQVAGVTTASATSANALPNVRYIVKRGTVAQSLAIPGRVVPVRSSQLMLRGSGTVTAVNIKPGQQVKEGDTLVEFSLEEESLQAAQTQATLAQLAAESQQARVDELKKGADASAVAQIQATLSSDRANIQKLVRCLAPYSPYLRGAPPGLPFQFDERTVRMGLNFTLVTQLGDLDLLGEVIAIG